MTTKFRDITPAILHQLTECILEQDTNSRFSEFMGVLRLRGRFSSQKTAGKNTYAKISDDGGVSVSVTISTSLVDSRGVVAGSDVIVTGRLRIVSSQYGLEIRLLASDIELEDISTWASTELTRQGGITLDLFRTLPTRRNQFPDSPPFDVTVIHSSSAESQVFHDCLSEIARLGNLVTINTTTVNMLDAVALASAIFQAPDTGVLIIIRGGGNAADFAVFEDPRVLKALSEKNSFRITGLGHTGNQTLLDMVADYSANTPAQAGLFVREKITAADRLSEGLVKQLEQTTRERNIALEEKNRTRQLLIFALWGLIGAFMFGFILSRFF